MQTRVRRQRRKRGIQKLREAAIATIIINALMPFILETADPEVLESVDPNGYLDHYRIERLGDGPDADQSKVIKLETHDTPMDLDAPTIRLPQTGSTRPRRQ